MQAHPNTEPLPIFVSFWSYICFILVCWILCWDGIIRWTGDLRSSMEVCPLQGAQRDAYTRLDGASCFCPYPNFMRPHYVYVLIRFCFYFFRRFHFSFLFFFGGSISPSFFILQLKQWKRNDNRYSHLLNCESCVRDLLSHAEKLIWTVPMRFTGKTKFCYVVLRNGGMHVIHIIWNYCGKLRIELLWKTTNW